MFQCTQVAEICRGWYQQVSQAVEAQQAKKRQGNGPLAEIDYWRERNAALSALYEQLKVNRALCLIYSVDIFRSPLSIMKETMALRQWIISLICMVLFHWLLQVPKVKALLDIYYNIDNAFEFLKQDLTKFYTEAKDNVRFLSTLERHFKNVTHGANFQVSSRWVIPKANQVYLVLCFGY